MAMPKLKQGAWKLFRHYGGDDDLNCLRRLLGSERVPPAPHIDVLIDEIAASPELRRSAGNESCRRFYSDDAATSAADRFRDIARLDGAGRGRTVLLYVTARLLRPEVIVETGCFTGWDSAVLLQALDRNGAGHLYTIDLPARDGRFSQHGSHSGLPEGMRPGFLVPEPFCDRWTFIEGNVRQELMPLLERIAPVDLFLHDSDHTYPHMMWEYTAILPHMRDGGVIVSDDIAWNTAFWDFASALGRRPVVHRSNPNVGAVRVGGGEA